jgi:hypothetical protein
MAKLKVSLDGNEVHNILSAYVTNKYNIPNAVCTKVEDDYGDDKDINNEWDFEFEEGEGVINDKEEEEFPSGLKYVGTTPW